MNLIKADFFFSRFLVKTVEHEGSPSACTEKDYFEHKE